MANIERGKEILEAINQKLENDLEISVLSGDGYHLREDSPTVQSLFSNYSEQDQQAAIEYVNAFPDEARKNYNIGLDDLQAKETEKIQENIDPAVQKQINEILTQISNGEPLANIAFDAARREGSDFYKAVQEIATHNVFLQVELEKELYNVTNEGISDISAHRSFNQQLELMPAEIRLKVAQEIEADPKSTHYTINFTSEDVKKDIMKRQEAERKETQTMANEKLPNVREMSSEELAKEYAERAIRFYIHHSGTELDKQRIDEIDASIDEKSVGGDMYAKKYFDRDVRKFTKGISLDKIHTLKNQYEDNEQERMSHSNKPKNGIDKEISVSQRELSDIIPEALSLNLEEVITPIEINEPVSEKETTVEQDIKKAEEKVKIDNSAFLFPMDDDDEKPDKKSNKNKQENKGERKGFFASLKETLTKSSEAFASFTSKFVTEAIRPLKEQTNNLQKQTITIKEQANENFAFLKEQITNLSNQVITLTQQLTEQGRQANERIAVLEKQVHDYASENASLKRQLNDKGMQLDSNGATINNKKFMLLENKIVDLQDKLTTFKKENETLKNELVQKDKRDANIAQVINEYKAELDTYKGIIKGTLAVTDLNVVMRIQSEALKENIGCETADFYRKDPVNNQFYKINEHNERQYIDIKEGTLIHNAIESGKSVIDNDYRSGDIGDNTPSKNPYSHIAVVPYMSKDENGNDTVIGFTVAKDTVLNAEFNEERVLRVTNDTLRTVDTKLSNELQHDIKTHDAQTQLKNQVGMRETFEGKIYDTIQNGSPVSAIRIGINDIDALKEGYGAEIVNRTLRQVADIVNENHRSTDIVFTPARLDRNKFVVLIQGDEAQAYNYAVKLNQLIDEAPVIIGKDSEGNNKMLNIHSSIGVAQLNSDEFINKTRDQMFEVFKNKTSVQLEERYGDAQRVAEEAQKSGDDSREIYRVIADDVVMANNQQVFDKLDFYYANPEVKTLTTPLLGKTSSDLVSMEKQFDSGFRTITSLSIKGEPELRYNGIVYTNPENYPQELKDKLVAYNYEGVEVINEPTIEMAVAVYDAKTDELLNVSTSEWKPSDLSASAETIKHKLLEKSTDAVLNYEKTSGKTVSNEKTAENRRKDDNTKQHKSSAVER